MSSLAGAPLDLFVGRTIELSALARLQDDGARLVTVKGPGGAGKTRLIRQFAGQSSGIGHAGVCFVDLTEARTVMGILDAVGLGLDLGLTSALDEKGLVAQVGGYIEALGSTLILLDNFEQVVRFAPETVGVWLRLAPEAVFLVTSREPLRIRGEHVMTLAPLPEDDGVALFVARAHAAGARWPATAGSAEAISAVVDTLDGLPLAIELAAARTVAMAPTELLPRLTERFRLLRSQRRDRQDRQATLWAVIHWSWDLLDPWERAALTQLSVFRDGFSMAAAEAVIDVDTWADAPLALDLVGALHDKSLLRRHEGPDHARFSMYVSVHQFARDRLESPTAVTDDEGAAVTGPDATMAARRRHARHFGQGQPRQALNALAPEFENLHTALLFALEQHLGNLAANLANALGVVFEARGPIQVALDFLERVLTEVEIRPEDAVQLRRWQTHFLAKLGRPDEALAAHAAALAIAQALDTPSLTGSLHGDMGNVCTVAGRPQDALSAFKRALAIRRTLDNTLAVAGTLMNMGALQCSYGLDDLGLGHLETALALAREAGRRRNQALIVSNIALVHLSFGRLDEARALFEEAIEIARDEGDVRTEGWSTGHLGKMLFRAGQFDAAIAELEHAIGLCDRMLPASAGVLRTCLAITHARQGDIPKGRKEMARGRAQLGALHGLQWAEVACRQAEFEAVVGNIEGARTALAEAVALIEAMAFGPRSLYSQALARARSSVSHCVRAESTLVVGPEVDWFQVGDGDVVWLTRRKALRRIVQALVDHRQGAPGLGLSLEALLAAGWPDERVEEASGRARVYTAINTLRKLGLEAVLLRNPDGYAFDPEVVLAIAPD